MLRCALPVFSRWCFPLPYQSVVKFDLHCHSTISDGTLPPQDVVQRAAKNGVTLLALTDHDDFSGYAEAALAATTCGIDLVSGVEISIEWRGMPIHIVGLGFAPDNAALLAGLAEIRFGRVERARRMSDALARIGIGGVFTGAMKLATNPSLISRSHFARYLVSIGVCNTVQSVFNNYLTPGKPGYVEHKWVELAEAVAWIKAAGGVAIVAHPGRYKLSGAKMRTFLGEFRDVGGEAIEVVSGSHSPDNVLHFARLARYFGFHASSGSDFHCPDESYIDLGRLAALPEDLKPVWRLLA